MIEIEPKSKRGFIYGEEHPQIMDKLKCKIERYEKVSGSLIQSFTFEKYERDPDSSINLLDVKNLACIHGCKIEFKSVNRLPQDGWQELIDCWSCHDHEFKGMLDLKIRPRKEGVLVSNFYLIIDQGILPECCNSRNKYFYNEIKCGFSDDELVYKFFQEFFEMKNSLVLKVNDVKYEIKLFYECVLISNQPVNALKVGFKETTKQNDDDLFIGEYFKNKIVEILQTNSIKVKLLGFELSFIINKKIAAV